MNVDRMYRLTVFVFVVAAVFVLFGGIYFTSTFNYSQIPNLEAQKAIKQVNQFTVIKSFLTSLFFLALANIFLLYNLINMVSKVNNKEENQN